MNNLGEQFLINRDDLKANPDYIFQGEKYRITVLSDILIRLEYNKNGVFNDGQTQLVINRKFPEFEFKVDNRKTTLSITTKYFKLDYSKEAPFLGTKFIPASNLKISLLGSEKFWYYKHPEVRNYYGTNISLDDFKNNLKLVKGLYSLDGFASLDDSKSGLINEQGMINSQEDDRIDVYVFMYKKDFNLCLNNYFKLTGYPPLIPRYALGNWWYRDKSYQEENIYELIDKFNKKEIPLSVFVLNKDWHDSKQISRYTFDSNKIKDPSLFFKKMHAKNVKVGLALNPVEGIYPFENKYQEIKKYVGYQKDDNIPFSPLNINFLNAYLQLLIKPLELVGTDFIFIDYYDKKNLLNQWILNHYHYHNSNRDEAKRGLILSRNSLTGNHRYPILYSGKTIVSWETLKTLPFYNSTSANIGISYWSHDIGGFHKGIEDKELYVRYVQLGVFSPLLRLASDAGHYYKREPWKWDIQTETIVKEYLQLRHRLIPYIYTECFNYYKKGEPIIRPLYYTNPDLYDLPMYKNEYYFGSQMLVSPITDKKDEVMNRVIHRFYLPKGMWYDFKTGKKFPGDKKYIMFIKDKDYPVFCKAGSIICMSNDLHNNYTNTPLNMEINIFPGKNNSYNLYEDDSITNLYKQGYYLITNIDYNYRESNYTIIIRPLEGKKGIISEKRNYKFRFRNTRFADDVIVYLDEENIPIKKYLDENDFIVEVNNVNTLSQLTINCKGKDIEIDAVRIINEEIDEIISDLQIETVLKEEINQIIFSEESIKKKRIAIRKLKTKGLDTMFIKLFIKLLEYIEQL